MPLGDLLRRSLERLQWPARSPAAAAPGPPPAASPQKRDLLPGNYWHFTSASPVNFLFNNVRAGRGWLSSLSEVRRQHGERFITLGDLYPLTGEETERVFESVRAERFPEKPSRRGALFLFHRRDFAEASASQWKPESDAAVLRVRIGRTARVHMGHLGWFEPSDAAPADNAASYWAGKPCPHQPGEWEYVVDGKVYFPDWREPPFTPRLEGVGESGTAAGLGRPEELVTCPTCGVDFRVALPNAVTLTTADRVRCIDDPDRAMLHDCPHVGPLIQAAWGRLLAGG